MPELTIIATVHAGANIMDAVEQAMELAKKLDVAVEFKFNGIPLLVFSSSDPMEVADEYFEAINKPHKNTK